jgi:hypothetical protein
MGGTPMSRGRSMGGTPMARRKKGLTSSLFTLLLDYLYRFLQILLIIGFPLETLDCHSHHRIYFANFSLLIFRPFGSCRKAHGKAQSLKKRISLNPWYLLIIKRISTLFSGGFGWYPGEDLNLRPTD